MEEIKVGEYIRSKDGYIGKVQKLKPDCEYNQNYLICEKDNVMASNYTENIANHSPNIKDLVQAGDIILYTVNSKMTDIEIVKEHIDARTQEKTLRVGLWSLEQVEIKEILTKEQFDLGKYIVGDESNE